MWGKTRSASRPKTRRPATLSSQAFVVVAGELSGEAGTTAAQVGAVSQRGRPWRSRSWGSRGRRVLGYASFRHRREIGCLKLPQRRLVPLFARTAEQKKTCPSHRRTGLLTCGATFTIDSADAEPSHEHANTCSALDAGSRSRYSVASRRACALRPPTFPLSLGEPFTIQLTAGIPAAPALCECS